MPVHSVLVVEDDATLRQVVADALENEGHRVGVAATAADALDHLGRRAFDVVLLDVGLPDMNGLTLLEAARSRWPSVSILVLTGRNDAETAVKALKLGARDYLVKPFRAEALLSAVDSCPAAAAPRTITLAEESHRAERDAVVAALQSHGGDRERAARALGISRRTLYRRLRDFGLLDRDEPAAE